MRDYLQKFNVENIKIELEKCQYTKEKIIYLIDIKTQSKQMPIEDKLHLGAGFLLYSLENWCDAEIQKLKELEQLELQYFDINKSDHQKDIDHIGKVELENLSQQIVMFHELGIFQFLKDRFKIHEKDHTTIAKLFCHLTMNNENFSTKVTSIKNLKEKPEKIISKKSISKINTILSELNLSHPI